MKLIESLTRHLEQDMLRWLREKLGMAQPERRHLTKKIMELRKAKTLDRFNQKQRILGAKILARHPEMAKYYNDFTSVLCDYVVLPILDGDSKLIDTDFKTQRNRLWHFTVCLVKRVRNG